MSDNDYAVYLIDKWRDKMKPIFMNEAREFLTRKGFLENDRDIDELAEKWQSLSSCVFDPASPQDYYLNWKGETGASNIVVNIINQFSNWTVAFHLIGQFDPGYNGVMLDFGCGTAAVSLSWQRSFAKDSLLMLADVENLPREFVKYQIEKYPQYRTGLTDISLNEIPNNSIDSIMCIDVLEHLREPTTVFELLDRKLKNGGFMFLQAPWGGDGFEHLPEAPLNWEQKGGKKLLETGYEKITQMNPLISLSAVYLKK